MIKNRIKSVLKLGNDIRFIRQIKAPIKHENISVGIRCSACDLLFDVNKRA